MAYKGTHPYFHMDLNNKPWSQIFKIQVKTRINLPTYKEENEVEKCEINYPRPHSIDRCPYGSFDQTL